MGLKTLGNPKIISGSGLTALTAFQAVKKVQKAVKIGKKNHKNQKRRRRLTGRECQRRRRDLVQYILLWTS